MKNGEKRKISKFKTVLNKCKIYITGSKTYSHDKRILAKVKNMLYIDPKLQECLAKVDIKGVNDRLYVIKNKSHRNLSDMEKLALKISEAMVNPEQRDSDTEYLKNEEIALDLENCKKRILDIMKELHNINKPGINTQIQLMLFGIDEYKDDVSHSLEKAYIAKRLGKDQYDTHRELLKVNSDAIKDLSKISSTGELNSELSEINSILKKNKTKTTLRRGIAIGLVTVTGLVSLGMATEAKIQESRRNDIDLLNQITGEPASEYYKGTTIYGDQVTKYEIEEAKQKALNKMLSDAATERIGIDTNVSVANIESTYEKDNDKSILYKKLQVKASCNVDGNSIEEKIEYEASAISKDSAEGRNSTLRRDKEVEKLMEFVEKLNVRELSAISKDKNLLERLCSKLGIDEIVSNLKTKILEQHISKNGQEFPKGYEADSDYDRD